MPVYVYECEDNGTIVEIKHSMDIVIRNWGELCFAARLDMGETDFEAPVRKRMTPPAISIPLANSHLKNEGFTKLVKRDHGVYENVTATGDEHRYMVAGDPESRPHLHKKVGD